MQPHFIFYIQNTHKTIISISSSGTLNIGTNGTITVSGSNYGTLSCSSSNTNIATCSVSGTTVTIVPKAAGSATITVSGAGGTNYNSISKIYAATVQQAYQWTLTDYDKSGTISVGDYVTPKISSIVKERFYIMGIDGTGDTQTARLLAANPINTASLTQACEKSELYIGTSCYVNTSNPISYVPFTSGGLTTGGTSKYADASNTGLKYWINQYTAKLVNEGLILEDIETTDGGSPVSGVKGRPFWFNTGNSTTDEWTAFIKNRNIYVSSAWSGSGFKNSNYMVYYCSTSSCYASSEPRSDTHAVQPVIRVKTSKIQK